MPGLLSRHIYNAGDVEDVAQEVFIKAYRALGSFRGDSKFYTWLYRIAVNTARNHIASGARRMQSASVNVEEAEMLGGNPRLQDAATPEGNILRDELSQRLEAALAGLPENHRAALMFREMDGLSYEQIAEVMGCPIGTVRSRIFRAREALGEELDIEL